MNKNTQELGKFGEDQAVFFLKKNGYRILEQNFRNKLGELDIVADHDKTICFVEVKTRANDKHGSPLESVSSQKMRKISRLALSYLKYKGLDQVNARFDVVSIQKNKGQADVVELIQDAFDFVP